MRPARFDQQWFPRRLPTLAGVLEVLSILWDVIRPKPWP